MNDVPKKNGEPMSVDGGFGMEGPSFVPIVLPSMFDDTSAETAELKHEIARALLHYLFANPAPKAVLRRAYILAYRYWPALIDDMPQIEIAALLGCSPQAVNQFLKRQIEADSRKEENEGRQAEFLF